jgi:dolichol-phosphate mannosyltransferase
MKKIAVIIPAYGESENIVDLCKEILAHCNHADILIVDDSPDWLTVDAIKLFSHPQVGIIHRDLKGGRGNAVLLGISQCINGPYDYFLEMDADFSHPPAQIPLLIKHAEDNNLDLLIASRYLGDSKILNWSLSRRVFSKCSNFIARILLQVPVHDYTNGFRLYSKRAAVELVGTCGRLGNGFIALSEILVNLYYRQYLIGEVSTIFINRVRGESSLSRKEIWSALVGLERIYQLKRKLSK